MKKKKILWMVVLLVMFTMVSVQAASAKSTKKRPGTVTDVLAMQSGNQRLKIVWRKQSGVKSYIIYQKKGVEQWKKIKETSKKKYKTPILEKNVIYQYRVKAKNSKGISKHYSKVHGNYTKASTKFSYGLYGTYAEKYLKTPVLSKGNAKLVTSAKKQLGNKRGKKFWKWYGFSMRVEWCACFVSWNANQRGEIKKGRLLKFAYCQTGADWFRMANRWKEKGYKPVKGDIIFFDWGTKGKPDGHTDHVGIVEKVKGNRIYTIEGNKLNRVQRKSYSINNKYIYGYGIW